MDPLIEVQVESQARDFPLFGGDSVAFTQDNSNCKLTFILVYPNGDPYDISKPGQVAVKLNATQGTMLVSQS